MLGRLIAWSAGEVRIQVCGASTERFLNLCMRGEIALWDVVRQDGRTLTATLSIQDFYALRRLMGRSGCQVRVTERRGGPFWLKKLRVRWVLSAGFVGVIGLLVVLSQFLWVLEVDAAPGIPVGHLREVLRQNGVYEGAWLRSIDTDDVRRAIQSEIPEVGVIALTYIGNALRVQVDAAQMKPLSIDRTAPTGLVATREGVISQVTATGGQPLVKPGDAVEVGQLLISSAIPNTTEWGTPHRGHGMGRIMAYTRHTVELLCPLSWTEYQKSDKTHNRYALILGDRRIKLYLGSGIPAGSCDKIIEKTRLSIGSRLLLPLTLECQTWRETDAVQVTGDAQTVGEQAAKQWLSDLQKQIDGVILESNWQIEEIEGAVRVSITAACEEQIGAEMIDRTPLPEPSQPS